MTSLGPKNRKRTKDIEIGANIRAPKKARIILDLDEEAAQHVDAMMKSLKLKRRTEVIRYAIGLLTEYSAYKSKGYHLLFKKGSDVIRLVVPQTR